MMRRSSWEYFVSLVRCSPKTRPLLVLLVVTVSTCVMSVDSLARKYGNSQSRGTIVVYSDGSADHFGELKRFIKNVGLERRLKVIDGKSLGSTLPQDWEKRFTLVHFGTSMSHALASEDVPTVLKDLVKEMPFSEAPNGEVTRKEFKMPIFCFGDNKLLVEAGKDYRVISLYAQFTIRDDRDDWEFCRFQTYGALAGLGYDMCTSSSCKKLVEETK